jgi:hypothetical protein
MTPSETSSEKNVAKNTDLIRKVYIVYFTCNLFKFENSFLFAMNLYVLQQGPVSMSGENCLFECSWFVIFG